MPTYKSIDNSDYLGVRENFVKNYKKCLQLPEYCLTPGCYEGLLSRKRGRGRGRVLNFEFKTRKR